jgi:hypothetical protein
MPPALFHEFAGHAISVLGASVCALLPAAAEQARTLNDIPAQF